MFGFKESLKDSKDLDEDLDLLGSVSIQSCHSDKKHWIGRENLRETMGFPMFSP